MEAPDVLARPFHPTAKTMPHFFYVHLGKPEKPEAIGSVEIHAEATGKSHFISHLTSSAASNKRLAPLVDFRLLVCDSTGAK